MVRFNTQISSLLTQITTILLKDFEYITPKNPEERGAQISIRFKSNVRQVFKELEKRGVMVNI